MAPPRKDIDHEKVRKLAAMGLSVDEIAAVMDCSARTIQRRCVTPLKTGRLRMTASLKRSQFVAAKGGNVTMLIWMGKQYLGQSDKVETTNRDKAEQSVGTLRDHLRQGGADGGQEAG